MKVHVMTLSGECLECSFDPADTLRDLAIWIRSKMGIPVAVQNLVKDQEVFKDPSVRFEDAFPRADEVTLTVLRRPYSSKERAELFQRLVRATTAGDTRQVRELMKEGAPVIAQAETVNDVSVNLEHWEDIEEQEEPEPKKEEKDQKQKGLDEEMKEAFGSEGEESEKETSSSVSVEEEVAEKPKVIYDDDLPCGGLTPLLMALAIGREDLANDFRQIGAPEPDLVPKTPSLRAAATQLSVVEITRHLMAGADPNTQLQRGEGIRATESGTLLHACAAHHENPGMFELAQLLIHKNANLDAGDSEGDTPLAHARYFGSQELYKLYSGCGGKLAGPFYAAARWNDLGAAPAHAQAIRNLMQHMYAQRQRRQQGMEEDEMSEEIDV